MTSFTSADFLVLRYITYILIGHAKSAILIDYITLSLLTLRFNLEIFEILIVKVIKIEVFKIKVMRQVHLH
jgi:hypothetical protein